jgi:hypothetical protein
MGWSGVWVDGVDGVGSDILAGFTCISNDSRTTDVGAGTVAGAGTNAGAGAGVGTGTKETGDGWKRKFEGPGL